MKEIPGIQKDTNNGALRHMMCCVTSHTVHVSELLFSCTQQVTINLYWYILTLLVQQSQKLTLYHLSHVTNCDALHQPVKLLYLCIYQQTITKLFNTTCYYKHQYSSGCMCHYPGQLPDRPHYPARLLNNPAGNHTSGRRSEVQELLAKYTCWN
jgi:hypothetical protein